jgi:hypothetical protein
MSYPSPDEFLPLPYYSWISRPDTVPLDVDECATSLYLNKGNVERAAARLKITTRQLKREIRRSSSLKILIARLRPA